MQSGTETVRRRGPRSGGSSPRAYERLGRDLHFGRRARICDHRVRRPAPGQARGYSTVVAAQAISLVTALAMPPEESAALKHAVIATAAIAIFRFIIERYPWCSPANIGTAQAVPNRP